MADEALVGVESRGHARGIHHSVLDVGRERVVWIRIERRHVLRPRRTGIAAAFQLGYAQDALLEEHALVFIEPRNRVWYARRRKRTRPRILCSEAILLVALTCVVHLRVCAGSQP